MGKKILSQITVIMLICVLITGCGASQTTGGGDTSGTASGSGASDYSNDSNWLAKPDITKTADTFYIYPTAYTDPSEDAAQVCDIDNEQMRSQADLTYDTQASAYEKATNVFAPYYRQINMADPDISGSAEKRDELLQATPKSDIYAALDYYFENLNNGRPFFLASHSQGSQLMTYV